MFRLPKITQSPETLAVILSERHLKLHETKKRIN